MKKKLICKICKKEYIGYHNSKYCDNCTKKSRCINVLKHYYKKFGDSRRIRICKECKKEYKIDANSQKYCKTCAPIVRKRNSNLYTVKHWDVLKSQWAIYQKYYRSTEHGRQIHLAARRKRRLKKKLLTEEFTIEEWNKKLEQTKGICPKCDKFVGVTKLTLDHIIPISKASDGFVYTINNVQPLCSSCNSKKSNKLE